MALTLMSSVQRQAAYRARMRADGKTELRGVYLPADTQAQLKALAGAHNSQSVSELAVEIIRIHARKETRRLEKLAERNYRDHCQSMIDRDPDPLDYL